MLPFLALHAIAAPRGEGLRPEFIERFKRIAGDRHERLPKADGCLSGSHRPQHWPVEGNQR
jgi:hypothetical protein